jgi:hypothetical protein
MAGSSSVDKGAEKRARPFGLHYKTRSTTQLGAPLGGFVSVNSAAGQQRARSTKQLKEYVKFFEALEPPRVTKAKRSMPSPLMAHKNEALTNGLQVEYIPRGWQQQVEMAPRKRTKSNLLGLGL